MGITFVRRDGTTGFHDSVMGIRQMLQIKFDENLTWWANKRNGVQPDCIAVRADLYYTKLEEIRRSQTWEDEVYGFIEDNGIDLTPANLKKYGVMDPERKARPHAQGPRNGGLSGMKQSEYADYGRYAVSRLLEIEFSGTPDGKMVSYEWAKNALETVLVAFVSSDANLDSLPDIPKVPTLKERNDEIRKEIDRLSSIVESINKVSEIEASLEEARADLNALLESGSQSEG